MSALLEKFNQTQAKAKIPQVRSGDTVRVHQRIVEGGKERVQVFEGVVIRTDRMGSSTAAITLRRMSSGVGVEKGFMLHAPNVEKVEVIRRSKVRRNYLSYMRNRSGKSARLRELGFNPDDIYVEEEPAIKDEATTATAATKEEESSEATPKETSQKIDEEVAEVKDKEVVKDESKSKDSQPEEKESAKKS
ncbi:MAG: 50S ribosomal protein L19 [Candidatus Saccharimonadales bacterium]